MLLVLWISLPCRVSPCGCRTSIIMGCVAGKALTEEEKRDRERNAQIERELAAERKLNDKEVKVLLLGAGESGKSTIAKQMKFIYLKGFTEQEKEVFKRQIHQNIIFAMQVLLKQCRKRELEMSPENEVRCNGQYEARSRRGEGEARTRQEGKGVQKERGAMA